MMYLSTKYVKASIVEYQGDGKIRISYFFPNQPLQIQIFIYKIIHRLK